MVTKAFLNGINHYSSGINGLNKCVTDASWMGDVIKRLNPTADIATRFDYMATRQYFFDTMHSQADQLKAGDTLIYFQSSHGTWNFQKIPNFPEYYRATGLEMTDGELWDWEVKAALSKFQIGVNIIWITDSCFSEDNFKSSFQNEGTPKLSNRPRTKDADVTYQDKFYDIKCNVIAISSSDQYSVSYESKDGGVMTSALIRAAELDMNANYYQVFKQARQMVLQDGWMQRMKFAVINGAKERLTYHKFLR